MLKNTWPVANMNYSTGNQVNFASYSENQDFLFSYSPPPLALSPFSTSSFFLLFHLAAFLKQERINTLTGAMYSKNIIK